MSEPAIIVSDVTKIYKIYDREIDRLWEGLWKGKKQYHKSVAALENVSFEVPKGTTFGILGRNGSGKSTLLQIIAGVLQPTCGEVKVQGRVSALLELGSGFNLEFTGIDNVYLYGRILGLTDKEIESRFDEILEFADIGDFVYQPLRTYSSGMVVRLAFATAIAVDPDILIVDEALAVGDAYFQHKCLIRMKQIIEKGTTVLFVSHDIQTVKSLCENGILLQQGHCVASGSALDVANEYHRRLFETAEEKKAVGAGAMIQVRPKNTRPADDDAAPRFLDDQEFEERARQNRFGNGNAQIVGVEVLNSHGERVEVVDYGEQMKILVHCRFHRPSSSAVVGVLIRDHRGVDVIGMNSLLEHVVIREVAQGEPLTVEFSLENLLGAGNYGISPAITDEEYFHQPYYSDWVNGAAVFSVAQPKDTVVYGVFYPKDVKVHVWREQDTAQSEPKVVSGGG